MTTLITLFTEAWLIAQISFRARFEPKSAAAAILDGDFAETTIAKLREIAHKRANQITWEVGNPAFYAVERDRLEHAIEQASGLTLRPIPETLRAGFGTQWLMRKSRESAANKALVSKILTGKAFTDCETKVVKQWAMEHGINIDGLVG
jgi:hypothetical protein